MSAATPTPGAWGDPESSGDDADTLPDLLRVACKQLDALVERADALVEGAAS